MLGPASSGMKARTNRPVHGAPLRLRNEIQIGFKQVKWIRAIEFVADFEAIAGGEGGYNEDHEFFGYRQSI